MPVRADALHRAIAWLLEVGTWIASIVIAVGLWWLPSATVVRAGIGLFVALPVLRVGVMFVAFVRRRDAWGILIAGLVLTIIALGAAVGALG
ncbi:MAG TPA: DUF1634 domain-containing protein [Polyangiaceae bacterium]|jgi:uncharacterized membrane protein